MTRLLSKVALVTGAAGGIGAEIARCFAAAGAKLLVTDVLDEAGRALVQQIRGAGGEAHYLHLDVSLEVEWQRAMAATVQHYGRLDILVNNAARVASPAPIDERSVDDWDQVMSVNARGVFLGTKHAIPLMRSGGGGSIVNLSSIAAIGQSQIMDALYAASKGAVTIFTKVTAAQHARDGIRCNSIHPGPIDGELLRSVRSDPAALERRLARIPMARLGQAAEVAAAALYLASDEASYTTGVELAVDGGARVQ
ncbi:SDR family NAD(P)-dependent oxidoreductase [Aquabacterium sp.]|uniref:SDR family NAD(P)-dependent oxidoreductase n=1 Tax=Aquabacterium sp. TaxID=1872578 RepID=UPI002BB62F24|nr:glucose 1-dehydrogenase [Aquabacterium sp.]HSW06692.1 glucose 1-dehydrogenase [Aquabacterium sp.]